MPRLLARIEQLARQPLDHRVLVARAGGRDDPADGQRLTALGANLDRHLVGGATDAARAHLDGRHHVFQRLMEHLHRVRLGLGFHPVERTVDDALGDRLLALLHDRVHELGHDILELRIRIDLALLCAVTTGHALVLRSRLSSDGPADAMLPMNAASITSAAWRRTSNGADGGAATPCVSSTPRMMW